MKVEKEFDWLYKEPAPKMLLEFLKIYGIKEVVGKQNNPVIMQWAKDLGLSQYTSDEIAWCGLAMGIIAYRAGKPIPMRNDLLGARNWLQWGKPITKPELGNILVFSRPGSSWQGHVGLYIAETKTTYFTGGGNQGNRVSIVEIPKSRLLGARELYQTAKPHNVRSIYMEPGKAPISINEA